MQRVYGKATGAVFIDLSKAFDTISHSVLLSKLSRYGVNDMELQWFTDYLFLRKQIVQFNDVLSDPNPINTFIVFLQGNGVLLERGVIMASYP